MRLAMRRLGLAAILVAAAPRAASAEAPQRIVSIGGAVTEIVYALGAADRLVAVDSTSQYPPAARQLPNVGYMRQLAAEPILALQPSLVLAVEDSGPAAVLDQLRAAAVPLVMVPDDPVVTGTLDKVTVVASALGLQAKGDELRRRLDNELQAVMAAVAAAPDHPSVLFLLSIGTGAPLAAGRDTAAAGIIALAGGRNAVTDFAGYKPLSPEAAIAAAPDVLLLTSRGLDLLGGEAGLLRLPEIAQTPAARHHRVVTLDGLLLLGFGPRTGTAIRQLARQLHPSLQLPADADDPPAQP